MSSRNLLLSAAGTALILGYAPLAIAQTTITGETDAPLTTSTLGDTTIDADAVVTGTGGTLVTLDSDNDITNNGSITSTNGADNVVGVLISGGNTGNFTQSGTLTISEDFDRPDADGDSIQEGPFAQGSNITGILISGASPFIGNIEATDGGIGVEGNDSSGIRLATGTSITGNIINSGGLTVLGDNSTGIDIEGAVIGELANNGFITTQGAGARGVHVQADVSEGFSNTNTIANTGFTTVINSRQTAAVRELIDDNEAQQAGAAIEINSNIGGGVFLGQLTELVATTDADGAEALDDDGNVVFDLVTITDSTIIQNGAAPAVLIDSLDPLAPITLGAAATIQDPDDQGFDGTQAFGLVQQGSITASGILDDSPATAIELANVTVENGIFNSGALTTTTFRSGDDGNPDAAGFDGHARGIFLRENATADTIVNEGTIGVATTEADDALLVNTLPPRLVQATGIEISADSTVNSLLNNGIISIAATGRNVASTAIIDRSGTLTDITNQSSIVTAGVASVAASLDGQPVDVNLTAIDVSANTTGVSILQQPSPNPRTITTTPIIFGDVLFGSGDDNLTSTAGEITSGLSFGDGADTLSLANTVFLGTISDSDGNLDISVTDNSSLTQNSFETFNATNATFDSTSSFTTFLDAESGQAGTLIASNDIVFEDGSQVQVGLNGIVQDNATFAVADAGNLDIQGDLDSLANPSVSSFIYDTSFSVEGDTLLVTLDLREPGASVADGGLGLDTRQTAAFSSAFEALASNAVLGQAFTQITDEVTFNDAFSQLLPETAASPLFFIQSGVDGAYGAVGSHLENARRSQDKTGGAWLQQFTYFADSSLDQLSEQFRGFGFGFTGGIDRAWGPFHAIGASIGFASTEVEDVLGLDDPLDILTYQGGLYAGSEWNNFSLDLFAGGGITDIEDNRVVSVGGFTGQSSSERNASHINGSARLGYTAEFGDRFWVRPVATLDYLRLNEDAFEETGVQGIALSVASRTSERAGISGLLNAGATFEGNRTWIRPSIRGGYRTDFIADPILTQFQFLDVTSGTGTLLNDELVELEGGLISNDGFILGFTIAAGSKWSAFSFDFDSDIRDGFIRHTGRVVVRLLF